VADLKPKSKPSDTRSATEKEQFVVQLGRKPETENGVLFIVAKTGDTYASLTQEFLMWRWELYQYNDVERNAQLKKADRVYLRPKKNKSRRGVFNYTVGSEKTLWEVSQNLGIKLKKLAKRNQLQINTNVSKGQVLKTR